MAIGRLLFQTLYVAYLNQARTCWFLKIAFVQEVGMCLCICVSAPQAIETVHVK